MSYTEIVKFDVDGYPSSLGEVKNSHRSAAAIWDILELKYLPALPKPHWMSEDDYLTRGYMRSSSSMFESDRNPLQDVWDLFYADDVLMSDKIVLGTTFDNVVVKIENIKAVIDAFEIFSGESSLKEQADILKKITGNNIAIAWNQTSINSNKWLYYAYDDDDDVNIPYNILSMNEHWYLFDEL